jgi:flavorubredoxin
MSGITTSASAAEYRGRGNVTDKMEYTGFKTRQVAPGLHLLGGCFTGMLEGSHFHSHVSAYLIVGTDCAALVDTGHPKDWVNIEPFIRSVAGDRLRYIFPTHEEYPHAGNLGSLLRAFPHAVAVGDMRNYHLYYPDLEPRFLNAADHQRFELGGRHLEILPAVIHDLPTTRWAYDSGSRALFVSDAFAYSHNEHAHCTLFSVELPSAPSVAETGLVLDRALYWARFADLQPLIDAMHAMLDAYPTSIIAPAHGNVVTNPAELTALMDEALMAARLKGG